MNIQYLSPAEEAWFSDMVHTGGDLADLFADFVVKMNLDADYDTITISFDDDGVLRIAVEDSPYVIVMDENEMLVELYIRLDNEELELDGDYDFDEDGVETVIDIMISRVFDTETDVVEYG